MIATTPIPSDSPLASQKVAHSDISTFADASINLKREDAEEYRGQVSRLRDKLDRYAADHPDYGLIKTLLSGSLAKGTALKTLNDIDVAFYVKAEKAPTGEPELLNWLAERLREAYPQMAASQIQSNKHSVSIKYAVSGLSVDVVPVQYTGDADGRRDREGSAPSKSCRRYWCFRPRGDCQSVQSTARERFKKVES